MATHERLKTKFRIGSIHGRCNYDSEEKAFHSSDVPAKAVQARRQIRKSKHSNILGQYKNSWNNSTDTNVPICLRRQRQNSKHDRSVYTYNYRAEKLPPPTPAYISKATHLQLDQRTLQTDPSLREQSRTLISTKRTQEMPVHPNLEGALAWNCSTYIDRKDRAKCAKASDDRMRKSASRRKAPAGYCNPIEREKMFVDQRRKQTQELRVLASRPGAEAEMAKHPDKFTIDGAHDSGLKDYNTYQPKLNTATQYHKDWEQKYPSYKFPSGRTYMGPHSGWQFKYLDSASIHVLS